MDERVKMIYICTIGNHGHLNDATYNADDSYTIYLEQIRGTNRGPRRISRFITYRISNGKLETEYDAPRT